MAESEMSIQENVAASSLPLFPLDSSGR